MKPVVLFCFLLISYASGAQVYWQQHVDTKIEVKLDDKRHRLDASEEIVYTNNSPDTLNFIYMHLWPNAYKHDHTPFAQQLEQNGNTSFYYAKPEERGYIDSLDFYVDGQPVEHQIAEATPDIARVDLTKPLLPGGKIKITTPFMVKLPKVFSRLGHTGQGYYISQWFPKPAVYDRSGWHQLSYLDQGEFYSEFGSYEVAVTLPKNYVVMGTGNWMDESEVAWMDSLANKPFPSDTLYSVSTPESDREMKTVHFHEDNVHDFAWFADKTWVVRKDTVSSPGTGKIITTWAAFWPTERKAWAEATKNLRSTVEYYGKWVGPYPYNTIKLALGDLKAGGGMEYPTIAIIDKSARLGLRKVLIHEAGHNWFYGILASNERDHAWMDEGLNSFYEDKTTAALTQEKTLLNSLGKLNEDLLYYEMVATRDDQRIEQPSAAFTHLNYGLDVYYKTSMFLRMLEQYMGEADFEKGMKTYFDEWHHKHPYPNDFKACMKRNTSKPIDWFFDVALETDKRVDFRINDATVEGTGTRVTVGNNSGLKLPVKVNACIGDSVIASVWSEPFENSSTVTLPVNNWTQLKIDDIIPDDKTANNVYRRSGLSHTFGLKLQPFFGLNRSEKYKLEIAPAVAFNQYDRVMVGLLLHDFTFPENRFRFLLAPMYSLKTNSFVGAGSVGYIWYPATTFRDILLQVDAKSFHSNVTSVGVSKPLYAGYTKAAMSLAFTLKEPDMLSSASSGFLLKGYYVTERDFAIDLQTTLASQEHMYGLARYWHKNERTFNPFSYNLEVHGNGDFMKMGAEGFAQVDYNVKKKSLYVRAYLGKFVGLSTDLAVLDRYQLNANFAAANDYLYDGTYFGRNARNNRNAQQISLQEGGFKIPVFNNVYRNDNWLASINLASDIPKVSFPVRLFFDAGLIPNNNRTLKQNTATRFLFDGGIELVSLKGIISIYFPIIMSGDFRDYLKNTYGAKHVFERSISLTFHMQNVNWLRSPTKYFKKLAN